MGPTGAYTAIHRANFWWLNDRCGNVFSERYFFKCLNLSLHSKPFPLGNAPAVLWKLFSALSVQLYETSTLSNYNLSREIFLFYYGSCCLLFFSRKYWSLTMPRSIKSDTAGKLHTSHDSRALMVAVIAQISISFCLLKWMILLAQVTIHRPIILNEQLPVDTFPICDFFLKNPSSSASRTLPFWNTHPLKLISP